jgi:HEPN domain-containing protein
MSLKIIPLKKALPGSVYETNTMKSPMMLHAGRDYYNVCHLLQQAYKQEILIPSSCVEFPLMHQCLELLAKALATQVDTITPPNDYGHKTLKLMKQFEHQIPIFSSVIADSEKCNLIEELEKAYFGARYGEVSSYSDYKVYELFNEIAEDLMDAYHDLTGLPFLAKHFPVKKS